MQLVLGDIRFTTPRASTNLLKLVSLLALKLPVDAFDRRRDQPRRVVCDTGVVGYSAANGDEDDINISCMAKSNAASKYVSEQFELAQYPSYVATREEVGGEHGLRKWKRLLGLKLNRKEEGGDAKWRLYISDDG